MFTKEGNNAKFDIDFAASLVSDNGFIDIGVFIEDSNNVSEVGSAPSFHLFFDFFDY